MSPAREELRRMADVYWSQKQADNWWIGEYLRCVVMNNHKDKERILDLICELTDDEWVPIKGHLTQHLVSFNDKGLDTIRAKQQEVRTSVAASIDLLRAFS